MNKFWDLNEYSETKTQLSSFQITCKSYETNSPKIIKHDFKIINLRHWPYLHFRSKYIGRKFESCCSKHFAPRHKKGGGGS